MPKPRRQQDPYSTIFDFLFASYQSPRQNIVPGRAVTLPGVSGEFTEGMMHMAAAPAMYPIESVMANMNDEIDSLGTVKTEPLAGMKVEVGLGSAVGFFTDPRKAIDKSFQKYKFAKKWARFGAGTKAMDSAYMGVLAKMSGFSLDASANVGFALNRQDRGILFDTPSQFSSHIGQKDAIENLSKVYANEYSAHGITNKDVEEMVARSYNAGDRSNDAKAERIEALKQELENRGLSDTDAKDVAQDFWGDENDADDFGVWWKADADKQQKYEKAVRRKSRDAMLKRVQMEIDNAPASQRGKMLRFQRLLTAYSNNESPGGAFGVGLAIGKAQHVRLWMQDMSGGKLLAAFTLGDTGLLENFFSINKMKTKTKSGKSILGSDDGLYGVHYKGGDSTVGQFIEGMYYWHPVNIAKGLVWDGRTYYKMASYFRTGSGAEKALKLLGSLTPKQFLLRAKKGLLKYPKKILNKAKGWVKLQVAKVFSKLLGRAAKDLALLPLKELLKQAIIKIITQVIGNAILPGVGGIIGFALDVAANVVIWIAEKLLKPVLEFGLLMMLGIVALILLIFVDKSDNDTFRLNRHLNTPVNSIEFPFDTEITDPEEWAEESEAPEEYEASCPVPANVICTQGGCGAYSHVRTGRRAVDLAGGWTTSSPGIHAPADGRIVYSRASSTCRDGTNHGGIVIFEDSEGYRYMFAHVRPMKTGSVSAGEVIAEVQNRPEVERGLCWTGPHVHIEVQDPSGQYLDAEEFLNSIGCGFTCPASDQC